MDFIKFQVRAAIIKNYKESRLFGRGIEYAETVIQNAYASLLENKQMSIGSYESKSGDHITFKLDGELIIQNDNE
jgi:hypothetical protein